MKKLYVVNSLWILMCCHVLFSVPNDEHNPQLVLPSLVEVVAGKTTKLYLKSALLEESCPGARLEVNCVHGEVNEEGNTWSLHANEEQLGEYPLRVRALGPDGSILDENQLNVRVISEKAGEGRRIILMLVGDSLTHMSLYPNQIAQLLSEPGNPEWEMLGLHQPDSAASGVAHEGYGGWTWERFNSSYHPNRPPGSNSGSSPFVFDNNGEPTLDVGRYFNEYANKRIPDFVIFFLGINDCFSVDPDDPTAMRERFDRVMVQAEKLLAEFRKAAPRTIFGVCLTPEPNSRQAAFASNYGDRYTHDGWRRIQYYLVKRQLKQFENRQNEGIYVIPTSIVVDPISGYPELNAVHPNRVGSDAIGSTVYAWIKGRLNVDAQRN